MNSVKINALRSACVISRKQTLSIRRPGFHPILHHEVSGKRATRRAVPGQPASRQTNIDPLQKNANLSHGAVNSMSPRAQKNVLETVLGHLILTWVTNYNDKHYAHDTCRNTSSHELMFLF